MYEVYVSPFELYHYGILGQKWGVRRFQNPDGSLTEEGRLRYSKGKSVYNYESKATKKYATKFGTDSKVYERSAELEYRGAGKERSLQQHWLRKNYAQKGSAQEQKAAKEVARAEKKNAAQEQKAAKEAARAEKKDIARRDAIVKDLYNNPNYNKAIDLARLENADENGHIENEAALVKSFYKHLKELDPKAYAQSQELDKKYDMVWR